MKVYSLSGRSGTGKSFQAINLCKEKNIESIIDDGLFIYRNKVISGISAKRQRNIIQAVKTAIFSDDEKAVSHRASNSGHLNRPRHASPADYRHATALEALLGMLEVTGQTERLKDLLDRLLKGLSHREAALP